MSEPWHDINDPGFFFKPKPTPEQQGPKKPITGIDDTPAKPEEPPSPEVSFVSSQFEPHPTYGYAINSEAVVRGSVRLLAEATTFKKLTLDLFAIYENSEEDLKIDQKKYGTAYINDDLSFRFPGIPLYCHSKYEYNANKEFIKPIRYKAVITNERQDKPLEIFLDLPVSDAKKPIDLKEGMYDDKAHNAKPGKYPADPAQGYITGQPIYDLQLILEDYRYLPNKTANGVFGPKTDEAVKRFQADSLQKLRVDRAGGKLVESKSITYKGRSDGIVGSMTRNELEQWKMENFLRPLPELYHEDYDTEAVYKKIKPRGGDDFHDLGQPVLEAQKTLQKVNVYTSNALDGWFGNKMKDAIGIFQDAAAKGEFVAADNTKVVLDEKLTVQHRGVLDVWTQVFLKTVTGKGLKIAGKTGTFRYPLPKEHRDKGYYSGARAFGSNRSGERVHAGCDLYAPAGTKVYAIADGIVNRYFKGTSKNSFSTATGCETGRALLRSIAESQRIRLIRAPCASVSRPVSFKN
jgi:hypothetical protein